MSMHPHTTDPERLGTTRLGDGRDLAWAEWGPASGAPVLVCPGAATSRWLGFGAGPAHDLGLRLISLDRPGLGASDPHPERTLLTWADDIAQLVARRRLGEPGVIGFSQGAPFALACAAAGIVRQAAVVSGTDELAHPAFADVLPPEIQQRVVGMATDPSGTEADASPVHSPDHGATLARRLPDARHHLIPEVGGALLWTHAREILSAFRP